MHSSRWSTKARSFSTKGSPSVPPTSTSSTATATDFPLIAAVRCISRTRSGPNVSCGRLQRFRAGYEGWAWEPSRLLIDAARRGTHLI